MDLENDLEIVLAKWQARLAQRGVSEPTGYSKEAIAGAPKRLGKPLPLEMERFYDVFTPKTWSLVTNIHEEFVLFDLDELVWLRSSIYHPKGSNARFTYEDAPDGPLEPGWLYIGQFDSGDCLMWCEQYRSFRRAVLFVFLEGGPLGEGSPLVLGESLAQWLDRLLVYDGVEYAISISKAYESGMPLEKRESFLDHHLRLNPDRREFVATQRRIMELELQQKIDPPAT